jgi:hypothetical protein
LRKSDVVETQTLSLYRKSKGALFSDGTGLALMSAGTATRNWDESRRMKDMKERSRICRPPLAAEHARSERVVTFVTPGERDSLRRLSERWSLPLSATVYRLLTEVLPNKITDE